MPYLLLCALLPVIGLGARAVGSPLPAFVVDYVPDALSTAMVYTVLVLIFPRLGIGLAAAIALLYSVLTEFSQLYHAPWIDDARATWFGRLILGGSFDAVDLLCYAAGVALAVAFDVAVRRRGAPR